MSRSFHPLTWSWIVLAAAGFAQDPGPAAAPAAADGPSPRPALAVPEGFRAELVAANPAILWPSAVACLPDGSLLVAEDPMDMPGPSDKPIDRIWLLRWGEDGSYSKTLFADGLYAVFGILPVDDAVYVMNMPYLTVLRDRDGDGFAEERRILVKDLGVQPPGAEKGFNDHIVSGLQLGMDGWIYVAVGDKGIPKATGTDGSTITLRGGGIVRLRPDGSRLEVFASGLRNVLEPALDARDDLFTYDNTDDGLGWWTRVTHIIRGGYYGYPWDYREHPERHLPCMKDFGGGSPTGGACYREAAWPEALRGSFFWCEWAKKSIRRFRFAPKGASFAIAEDEDFIAAGFAGEFRPVDLCFSPDGRFLYVADWNFGGWQQDAKAGRLWRVRRADDTGSPRCGVAWPAADDPVDALLRRLESPSYTERLFAQRALSRRSDARDSLIEAIGGRAPPLARVHALWSAAWMAVHGTPERPLPHALDADITRDGGLIWAISEAVTDDDPSVRLQAWRAVRDLGIWNPYLFAFGKESDPHVRREAWETLASNPHAPDPPNGIVPDDPFERWPRRRERVGPKEILEAAMLGDDETWRRLRSAIHETYDMSTVTALWAVIAGDSGMDGEPLSDPRVRLMLLKLRIGARADGAPDRIAPARRADAVAALADLHKKTQPWDGRWWGTQPAKSPPPPKTEDWTGSAAIAAIVRQALRDGDVEVRLAAMRAVAVTRDPDAVDALFLGLRQPRGATEPAAAIDALLAIGTPAVLDRLGLLCKSRELPRDVFPLALDGLARARHPPAAAVARACCSDEDAAVRAAALRLIAALGMRDDAGRVLPLLADEAPPVRIEALKIVRAWRLHDALPAVIEATRDPATRVPAFETLARIADERALEVLLEGLADDDRAIRNAASAAVIRIRDPLREEIERRVVAGGMAPRVIAELQDAYAAARPVAAWSLLEPFPKSDPAASAAAGAALDPFQEVPDAAGKMHAWREVEGDVKDGHVDLVAVFGALEDVAVFGAGGFESPVARAAELMAGSDDGITIWLNGEQVHDHQATRPWRADQDRVRVKLRAGENRIAVRVAQGSGGWGFNLKIGTDPEGPLFERTLAQRFEPADYRRYAAEHRGDGARGRALFRDAAVAICSRCHVAEGFGARGGPDLGDVGAKYVREEIVNSILEPDARILDGYREWGFELPDGEVLYGLVRAETAERIEIVDAEGRVHERAAGDVRSRWMLEKSAMPAGLARGMRPRDFADLVAYLESLKNGAGTKAK